MNAPKHPLFPALAACALLLIPATSTGESVLTGRGNASAGLDFRIIIPPIMRVLENSHPTQLHAEAGGDWSAQQRLVVVSNMKRGFCVTLRMNHPQVGAWRVSAAQTDGVQLTPVNEGHRLCAPRAGHYTLLLDHEFDPAQTAAGGALRWPVQTDITAL